MRQVIFLVICIVATCHFWRREHFCSASHGTVPKILHQTAPKNRSQWHPDWARCQESWMQHFVKKKGWTYRMWTDEDLNKFMQESYPWFYSTYLAYGQNIQRIDIARYFILYHYGGIYADMDFFCFRYFMEEATVSSTKVSVVESGYKENENVQNSLMISPVGDPFWMSVVVKAQSRTSSTDVLYSTGPKLLSDVLDEMVPGRIDILPMHLFNPPLHKWKNIDESQLYTKHLNTVSWDA